jgi:protein tyrosine/serine phosphatase
MSRKSPLILTLLLLTLVFLAPCPCLTVEPAERPTSWAKKLDLPGVPNLHKINDQMYRGAQPTSLGFKELEKLGIKTIINLRAEHSDKDLAEGTKLNLVQIPMNAFDVSQEDVLRFLQVATQKDHQPVFFHCLHGADRTGTMAAAYRVVIEGWPKDKAIEEMTKGGYRFHSVWINLPMLIDRLDVDKMKADLRAEKPK